MRSRLGSRILTQRFWRPHRDALGRVIYRSDSIGCGLVAASPLIFIALFFFVMSSYSPARPRHIYALLLVSMPFVIAASFFFHRRFLVTFDAANSKVILSGRSFFRRFQEEFPIAAVRATVQRKLGTKLEWVNVYLPGWRIWLGEQPIESPAPSISKEFTELTGIEVLMLDTPFGEPLYTPKISRTRGDALK